MRTLDKSVNVRFRPCKPRTPMIFFRVSGRPGYLPFVRYRQIRTPIRDIYGQIRATNPDKMTSGDPIRKTALEPQTVPPNPQTLERIGST